MKNVTILTILLAWALQSMAIEVNNAAGNLADNITDHSVTALTVTGTMNAEDFYFIGNHLHDLTELDLANVTIEPCRTAKFHFWRHDFPGAAVPAGAFADMGLTRVVLPATAIVIQQAAFAGCTSLVTVTLPAALDSIGNYAFAGCSALTAVSLPASVTIVGDGAFMRCTSLESIIVEPDARLHTIGEAALMDCPSLTTVALGPQVTTMGERLLAGSGIAELDLTASNRLTSLGDWMMVQSPVTTIRLPENLTRLGQGAFLGDKELTGVEMGNRLQRLDEYVFACSGLAGEIAFEALESMDEYALYNTTAVTTVGLPASMSWLGDYAMAGMTGLESMTCDATDVPALGEDVWAGVNQQSVSMTVPAGSKDLYKTAEQWKEFFYGEEWLRGDVNGDGEVNIADINALLGIILGGQADEATMRRADVNQDGEIGIADVNSVMDIILSPGSHAPASVNTDDLLLLDDLAIEPGEQRTLTLHLSNAKAYSAMQCDIALPQGLTLVDGTVAAGQAAAGHVTDSRGMDASTTRTVVYSMSKQRFDGQGEAVITLTVQADASLPAEGQITLTNIVLADDNDVAWHVADCVARVSNSTGIEDLTAAPDRVWAEGHSLCIDARTDGVAQVVAINGMSRDWNVTAGVNRYQLEPGIYVVLLNGRTYKIAIK